MKNIIVPTDFSAVSLNAAKYACEVAKLINARIILLHILQVPVLVSEVPMTDYTLLTADATSQIEGLKKTLENIFDGQIKTHITTGFFLNELSALLNKFETFAVVMGTHGAGVREVLLGSYTFSVAHNLDCPLIIVPPEAKFNGIKKVGLACDMEDVSETMPLDEIRAFFKNIDASLYIFYAGRKGEKKVDDILLGSRFIQNELTTLHPQIEITTHDNVLDGIAAFAQNNDIDLLMLISKQHKFPDSIFHKSISKRMILHPTMPVMILHK